MKRREIGGDCWQLRATSILHSVAFCYFHCKGRVAFDISESTLASSTHPCHDICPRTWDQRDSIIPFQVQRCTCRP